MARNKKTEARADIKAYEEAREFFIYSKYKLLQYQVGRKDDIEVSK